MNFTNILGRSKHLISDNSPALLTAIAVGGVITTAFLTHKATTRMVNEEVDYIVATAEQPARYNPTKKELFQKHWKLYIPPVSVAAITCTSIVMANRIGARRAAAVAAAYTISEKAFDEYKSKVVERVGATKEQAIRDEIAQDRVNRTAANREVIITTNGGDVMCLDAWSGRYFQSDMETLRRAQNDINAQIIHADSAVVDDYYDIIGLEHTDASGQMGWNTNKMLDLDFSTTLVDDKTPCLVVTFASLPIVEPWRFV